MPSDTGKLSSANAQYIACRLASIGIEAPLSILDMGCGDGTIIRDLLPSGHKLYGYDLGYRSESLVKKLADYYPDSFEEHIRIAPDERTIPFDDNSFDVIYANQVFEHVKFLDRMMWECARSQTRRELHSLVPNRSRLD